MSPSAAAAISQVTAFLNQVFSQERHNECTYEFHFQGAIQQHLLDLVGVSWTAGVLKLWLQAVVPRRKQTLFGKQILTFLGLSNMFLSIHLY